MNILETLVQLRDDLKTWVTNNLNELNKKIDEKAIPIDSELNATSTNPVQNKVINAEISSLSDLVGDKSVASQISTAIANQDLFSGDYNDLQNTPNILDDGSNELNITDNDGNIIVKINNTGVHTTEIKVNNIKVGETLSGHTNNNDIHVTSDDKNTWNAKSDFSGDYNDLENAPNINNHEKDLIIADESNNIIAKINEEGIHTTALNLNGENIGNKLNLLKQLVGDTPVSEQISTAISEQEHFSGNYNDLINAPSISEYDEDVFSIIDSNGKMIATINNNGIIATNIIANKEMSSGGYRVLTTNDIVKLIHVNTIEPSALMGNNGDIYLLTE